MSSTGPLNTLLQQYEETLTSLVPPMWRLMDTYTHELPILSVTLYLLMVYFLPGLLKSKDGKSKPPSALLKYTMATWNLLLSVMSAGILLGTFALTLVMAKRGVMATICDTQHDLFEPSAMIFWGLIFTYSKYFELIDTLFLIVKNPERPVPFLHYYHHTTVLLFAWYATAARYTVGYWFGSINACVHMFMYYYYFRTELGYRPSWAKALTMFQISQMIAGIALNSIWAKQYFSGKNCMCKNPEAIMLSCLVMYASYLYLFVQFFVQRYRGGGKKNVPAKKID